MTETVWVSTHVFYGDLDNLIVGAIESLARALVEPGLARRHFFIRYWDGGPHLRFRVLPTSPGNEHEIRRVITERLCRYLEAHPSDARTNQQEYSQLAATLARLEGVKDYHPDLCPNNSLRFVPYQQETSAYGRGLSMDAAEQHFQQSSEIAFRMIRAGASLEQRAAVALAMLFITLAACEPDMTRAARRLVASSWLFSRRRTAFHRAVLEDYQAAYLRQCARLRLQAQRLWSLPDQSIPKGDGVVTAWLQTITSLRDRLVDLKQLDPSNPALVRGPDLDHQSTAQPEPLLVLLRCTHLASNRLGIAPAHEAYLHFLASRTLFDLAQDG